MTRLPVSALLLGGLLAASPVLAEQTWHLMSRHGECTDISTVMRHKLTDFPQVSTPDAFIKALKERGLEAELTAPPNGMEGLVLAKIPAKDWNLLIIRRDRCSSFSKGPD